MDPVIAGIALVFVLVFLFLYWPHKCNCAADKAHKAIEMATLNESTVELFGKEQYIRINYPYQRMFYPIDLKMVHVRTQHDNDTVVIWDVDQASNVASTYKNFYNYYDMPDSYLPAAGLIPLISIKGKMDKVYEIMQPVKQVLVEVRLYNQLGATY
jgi:hypothetical protein